MLSRWWTIWFLAALLLVPGCASREPSDFDPAPTRSAAFDPAVLTSGRFSTRHGTLHYGRELVLHADGHVTERLLVVATDQFAEEYRQPLSETDGWRVNREDNGERVTVTLSREYPDVDAFNAERSDEQEGVFVLMGGPLFHKQSFRATVGGIGRESLLSVYGEHPEATVEDWLDYLSRAVTFSYRITMPQQVTKSVNVEVVDAGRTVHWERPIGEMEEPQTLAAEAKRWDWAAWVLGGAILFVVVGAGGLHFTQRFWDRAE